MTDEGNDQVFGDAGDDVLFGDIGDDRVDSGGKHDDDADGNAGATSSVKAARQCSRGGDGDDEIFSGPGAGDLGGNLFPTQQRQ